MYILYSPDYKRYYVGLSEDIEARLKSHNASRVKSTKSFVPWILVHQQLFETRNDARKREKYLKSAAGRRWRKNNLGD